MATVPFLRRTRSDLMTGKKGSFDSYVKELMGFPMRIQDFLMQKLRSVRFRQTHIGSSLGRVCGLRISRNLLIDLHTRRFRKTEGDHTNINIINS
jgi:hypothetical protein